MLGDDDLDGALTVQVEGGEDGQETLRGEQEEYRQEEVRRSYEVFLIKERINYYYYYQLIFSKC